MPRSAHLLLAFALGCLLTLLLAEFGAAGLFHLRPGLDFPGTRTRLLGAALPGETPYHPAARLVPHPFTGYVANSEYPYGSDTQPVNDLGFHGLDPRTPREPGAVRVLLTGGSVAKGQAEVGGPDLAEGLGQLPRFQGKKIEVVSLALGGFKQPQQLHALIHALSLGAEFDLVLNLDGFNEVALPLAQTPPTVFSPVYPRDWGILTGSFSQSYAPGRLAELGAVRRGLGWWRSWLAIPGSQGSRLAVLLYAVCEKLSARQEARLLTQFRIQAGARAIPIGRRGPRPLPSSPEECLDQATRVWAESSRLMRDLCRARGIPYLHFLQPNQYDPVSPAYDGPTRRLDSPMRAGAHAGYPRLREAGARLRADGVPFHDLSGLFGAHPESMYSDDCCHYSGEGIRRVGQAMVEAVPASRNTPAASSPRK